MSPRWEPIGGGTAAQFPMVGKDWTGPENVEAILADDDSLKALRGVFTRPDGTRRLATVKYLSRTAKHTFTSPPKEPQ